LAAAVLAAAFQDQGNDIFFDSYFLSWRRQLSSAVRNWQQRNVPERLSATHHRTSRNHRDRAKSDREAKRRSAKNACARFSRRSIRQS
jgi:hypothetical protein